MFIVSESRRRREWHYIDGSYICLEGGVKCAAIRGSALPDPEKIKDARLRERAKLPANMRGMYRIEADEVTKVLWNDWQARQSVGEATPDNQES